MNLPAARVPRPFALSFGIMSNESDSDRERHLNWLATRLRVPVERIAEAAAWQTYSGPSDSLDLLELVFRLEAELRDPGPDEPKPPDGGG
jgi:acyl carrier protein